MSLPYCLLAMLVCVAGADGVRAQTRRSEPPVADREFRPAASVESAVELLLPDPASGRSLRRPVSDLLVRLSVRGDAIEAALRLANGVAVERDAGLFVARVYVVSGGRLSKPAEARCDRWIEDVAVCSVGCDGGAFALRRSVVRGRIDLTLVLGRLPRGQDDDVKPGIGLNACEGSDAPETLLAPAQRRATGEIGLHASP